MNARLQMLSPAKAAKVLGVSEATMACWRSKGLGPSYSKLNARIVRYSEADLLEYVQRVRRATFPVETAAA